LFHFLIAEKLTSIESLIIPLFIVIYMQMV
jgi:hypothetical protein